MFDCETTSPTPLNVSLYWVLPNTTAVAYIDSRNNTDPCTVDHCESTIHIPRVNFSDEGNYTCVVNDTKLPVHMEVQSCKCIIHIDKTYVQVVCFTLIFQYLYTLQLEMLKWIYFQHYHRVYCDRKCLMSLIFYFLFGVLYSLLGVRVLFLGITKSLK
jgi:hypothetical protein